MFENETNEDVIKALLRARQIQDVRLLKTDVLDRRSAHAGTCRVKRLRRPIDGNEVCLRAITRER